MAEAKKAAELSSAYYSHKRTTLLTSAALLLFSMPGVGLDADHVFGMKMVGLDPGFLRVMLFLVASYYLANFLLLWVIEAVAFARAADHGEASAVVAITEHLKLYQDFPAQIMADIRTLVTGTLEQSRLEAAANGWPQEISEVTKALTQPSQEIDSILQGEVSLRTLAAIDYAIEPGGSMDETLRQHILERLDQFLRAPRGKPEIAADKVRAILAERIEQTYSELRAAPAEFHHIRSVIMSVLEKVLERQETAAQSLKTIRSDLRLGPWTRRFLLFGIDLFAPALLFVVAAAHFAGELMARPWGPDLATLLGF